MRRIRLITTGLLLVPACFLNFQAVLAQSDNSWTVPIRLKIGAADSFQLYLGVRPNATAGFDASIDTLAPPPPPATPYAYFSLTAFPNFLQADFRNSNTDKSINWNNLRLVNTNGVQSRVSWNLGQLPASRQLFLNDTLDMRQRSSTILTGDQTVRITSTLVSVQSPATSSLPEKFNLTNYPNPFVASTTLEISLPVSRGSVAVRIFNLVGQEIRAFRQEPFAPGRITIQWDGLDQRGVPVPSGVYFCRLQAGDVRVERKLYRMR